jgi:hypothetical protein
MTERSTDMSDRPTLQEAADDALAVQNASNISGVVNAFARAMMAVLDDCRSKGEGTDAARRHPITILFMDKLNDMCGREISPINYCEAYEFCSKAAGKLDKVF